MVELNENEKKVLDAVVENIREETGGQFGWSTDVTVPGMTNRQVAGYLGQLVQKDMIAIWDEDNMVMMRKAGNEAAGVDFEEA